MLLDVCTLLYSPINQSVAMSFHPSLCISPNQLLLYLTLPYLTLPYLTLPQPHLTLPYLTLPYLTLPYLTLPYLTSPYFTLPYLTSPYLISPHLTLPYLTLPCCLRVANDVKHMRVLKHDELSSFYLSGVRFFCSVEALVNFYRQNPLSECFSE